LAKTKRKLYVQVYTDHTAPWRPRRYYGVFDARVIEIARFMYRKDAFAYVKEKGVLGVIK
jgi:hypothetical protein